MNKLPLPVLHSDEEAERFVDEADLSQYDLSGGRVMRFELRPPAGHQRVSCNLPEADVGAALQRAGSLGLDLEAYLARILHDALERSAS